MTKNSQKKNRYVYTIEQIKTITKYTAMNSVELKKDRTKQ